MLVNVSFKLVVPPDPTPNTHTQTYTHKKRHKLLTIPLSRFASSHHIGEVSQHSMPYWENLRPRPRLSLALTSASERPALLFSRICIHPRKKDTERQLIPVVSVTAFPSSKERRLKSNQRQREGRNRKEKRVTLRTGRISFPLSRFQFPPYPSAPAVGIRSRDQPVT